MSDTVTFIAALIVGLTGAGHCVGMCAGIAGVFSIGTETLSASRRLLRILAYNGGRVTSYVAAGALAGFAGQTLGGLLPNGFAYQAAMGISAAFAILLALYMTGWGTALVRLERLGGGLWRRLKPLGQRLMPARSATQSFGAGLVWGWLPCGLVYTALAWALVSGSPYKGALLMMGFGLGTLPALMTMGMMSSRLLAWRSLPLVRYAAGLVLVGIAVTTLWHGFAPAATHMGQLH